MATANPLVEQPTFMALAQLLTVPATGGGPEHGEAYDGGIPTLRFHFSRMPCTRT